MKTFLVFAVVLSVARASLIPLYTAAIPITTQYHDQDSLGQYSYGYSGGPSAKAEYKSLDGVTRGTYSYVDTDGKLQTVEYTADSENGFQASATNLPKAPIDDKTAPKPVEDTPEVAKARAEHLVALKEAEERAAEQPEDETENKADESQETATETESPAASESSTEPTESSNASAQQSSTENGPQTNNGLHSLGSELSLSHLSSLQLNSDLSSILERNKEALRLAEISPSPLIALGNHPGYYRSLASTFSSLPTQSHGFSVISSNPILTAVPTLRATSSQTISRTLPISLESSFLTQKIH